jgi:hypothetical protein
MFDARSYSRMARRHQAAPRREKGRAAEGAIVPDEPDDLLLGYLDTYVAAAIGRAISAWALLEHSINEVIWELAGVEKNPGACITSQLTSVARRMDALISLARLQKISAPTIGKLNKFKEKAGALAEKRNRVAHDPWYYGFDSKNHYRLQVTAKSTLDFAYKPNDRRRPSANREKNPGACRPL